MPLVKDKKIIYICHPTVEGDLNQNINIILAICREIQVTCPNTIPIAPYVTYFQYLDITQPIQYTMFIEAVKIFFERNLFDEMWVAGNDLTEAMKMQIEWAIDNDIPILTYTPYLSTDLENFVEQYENEKKMLH